MKILNNEQDAQELKNTLKLFKETEVPPHENKSIDLQRRPTSSLPTLAVRKSFKKDSKWKILKKNPIVRKKLSVIICDARSRRIRYRFIRAVRSVIAMIRFGSILADIARTTGSVFKAYEQMQDKMKTNNIYFDKTKYKSMNEKNSLNAETTMALRMAESSRTDEMISKAVRWLQRMRCFNAFPAYFQTIIATIGQFMEIQKDKVILREGQPPQCFYFLVSGRVLKTKLVGKSYDTSFGGYETIETLSDDSMFGEEGMFGVDAREYSVISTDKSQILSIANDDFFRLLNRFQGEQPPEHIRFLCEVNFMQHFPKDTLINGSGDGTITMFYFQPDKVITPDIRKSKFVYVVKTGKCSVLAEVQESSKQIASDEGSPNVLDQSQRVSETIFQKRVSVSRGIEIQIDEDHQTDFNLIMERKMSSDFIDNLVVDTKAKKVLHNIDTTRLETYESEEFIPGAMKHHKSIHLKEVNKLKSYWVHMKDLQESDSLGIESIDWGDGATTKRFAMISNGSVCIAINKKFLIENAGVTMTKMIRGSSFFLPSNSQIRTAMKKQAYWNRYKQKIYKFEEEKRKRK